MDSLSGSSEDGSGAGRCGFQGYVIWGHVDGVRGSDVLQGLPSLADAQGSSGGRKMLPRGGSLRHAPSEKLDDVSLPGWG